MLSVLLREMGTTTGRSHAVVWAILRGLLFVPAGALALGGAVNAGYFGVNLLLVVLMLGLVPAAVVCWVQASGGKAGDWWTAGFVAAWIVIMLLLPAVFAALGILH